MLTSPINKAVVICDHEYPVRPAFSLLTKLLDDFTAKIPQSSFGNPSAIDFPEATTYLQKYQDPRQADAIMKVQQELDETKIVLVRFPSSRRTTTLVVDVKTYSIKRSNRYCNVGRRLTIWWIDPKRCQLRARCSTRRQRRYVHYRLSQIRGAQRFPRVDSKTRVA